MFSARRTRSAPPSPALAASGHAHHIWRHRARLEVTTRRGDPLDERPSQVMASAAPDERAIGVSCRPGPPGCKGAAAAGGSTFFTYTTRSRFSLGSWRQPGKGVSAITLTATTVASLWTHWRRTRRGAAYWAERDQSDRSPPMITAGPRARGAWRQRESADLCCPRYFNPYWKSMYVPSFKKILK